MPRIPPKVLTGFTWLSVAVALAASWVWLGYVREQDGWGHLWFIFIGAPIALMWCVLSALVPNWDRYSKAKSAQLKRQTIVSGIAAGVILIEAILSFFLPKVGC